MHLNGQRHGRLTFDRGPKSAYCRLPFYERYREAFMTMMSHMRQSKEKLSITVYLIIVFHVQEWVIGNIAKEGDVGSANNNRQFEWENKMSIVD